jgi:ubiquinone/menaquinone biosynthesis C-methylase UbiE
MKSSTTKLTAIILLILSFSSAVTNLIAQETRDGYYRGREIAQTMHWRGAEWLIRENRENEERVSELLREMRIQPGMTICDLGAGNGYHALLMAEKVGADGKILAIDIQPEMLSLLKERAKAAGVNNVETILGLPDDPKIPPESCDLLLMVDVYHEISTPEQMLKHIRQSLSENGLVVLVEYREEDASVPIQPLHKMSKQQILNEYLPMGFELAREYDGLPWQHMTFFRRGEETN